jgi:XTP/dITP diphosphohydrolase
LPQLPATVLLATSNAGKIREISAVLQPLGLQLIPQSAYDIPDAEETGLTFVENAILKARNACQHTHLPCLAEDAGLIVDVLAGRPGIYSARYAGKGASNIECNAKLLAEMQDIPEAQRTARFYCVMAFMRHAEDPRPILAEGVWEGRILTAPVGTQGFGYDPVFYAPEYQCASAELAISIKNQISHRAKALQQLLQQLQPL